MNVKDFGATGSGVTDDSASIEAACLALYSAGGGTLYFPPGVYLLGTLSGDADSYYSYITARDFVSFKGAGIGASVLKVKGGENAAHSASNAPNIIATRQAGLLRGVTVSDLTFDWNGANNLLTSGMAARNNAAFLTINGAENFIFERCEVKETPGNQCVYVKNEAYGTTNGSGVTVRDCVFSDSGSGLVDNYNSDHSSVYLQCDDTTVENCRFTASQKVSGAAYELHGSRSKGRGNKSNFYSLGFYLASDGTAVNDITVIGDSHRNIEKAFVVSAPTVAVDDVKVSGSYFEAASGLSFGSTSYFINGSTISACNRLDVTGCTFVGKSYDNLRFMQQYKIASLNISGNTIKDFNGTNVYGVISAGLDLGSGYVVKTLKIEGNTFDDVSFPIYFNASALAAGEVSIVNNIFRRTAADSNAVITTAFTGSTGNIEGNTYGANYSVKYAGASNGLICTEPMSGSYTPVVSGSTSAGSGTYATQAGRYILVGKMCTYFFTAAWSAHTGTGNFQVSLPFAAANNASIYQFGVCNAINYTYPAGHVMAPYVAPGGSVLTFADSSGGAAANTVIDAAASINGQITYEIA